MAVPKNQVIIKKCLNTIVKSPGGTQEGPRRDPGGTQEGPRRDTGGKQEWNQEGPLTDPEGTQEGNHSLTLCRNENFFLF